MTPTNQIVAAAADLQAEGKAVTVEKLAKRCGRSFGTAYTLAQAAIDKGLLDKALNPTPAGLTAIGRI